MSRVALHPVVTVVAVAVLTGCGTERIANGPDVLLLTIDTLRADFVHSYGFAAPTTPNLDALAERGVLFEMALAASTATVPSHASIMTSRYVREHSVGASNGATRLEGVTTLAERFSRAGYDSAAFVSNVVLGARVGLDRGFARYDDDLPQSEANRGMLFERTADQTGARALEWLEMPRQRPFFLWVHLQDPHGPYKPPGEWGSLVPEVPLRPARDLPVLTVNRGRGGIPDYQALEGVRRASRYAGLYAGEVAFADHWIGRIVAAAERAGDERGIVVLLTADHGESQGEDGFFFQHGNSTTPEQARVPCVVLAEGVSPRRVKSVVSHVDVAPTLLELAGLPPLEAASGLSLAPLLRRGESLRPRSVLTDIGRELSAYADDAYVTVRVSRPDPGSGDVGSELANAIRGQQLDWQHYERTAPTGDFRKIRGQMPLAPEIVDYLAAEVPVVPAHAMSDADVERLRALGYLPPALVPDSPPDLPRDAASP